MSNPIATGFDFEPLPNGNVLMEFFGDDGKTFATQVVTLDVVQSMPTVCWITLTYIEHGPEVAKKLMDKMSQQFPDEPDADSSGPHIPAPR